MSTTVQNTSAFPRTSLCFPRSSAENLAAIAWLFGLQTPRVETARILELGCASAGNLIPFATRNRRATLVGVDASTAAVEAGRQCIESLGLGNVTLHCARLDELTAELGQFDYIICHDLYSHVTAQDRQVIARLCRDHLAADGVAYVSYNVYPGWKGREMVRDALLMEAQHAADSGEKLARARRLFAFLKRCAPHDGSSMRSAVDECESICADDAALSEFLQPNNVPCYFSDFVARAEAEGLAYLADANPVGMFVSNVAADAREALVDACGHSQVALEQRMDFLGNRSYRQSLLVHADRAGEIVYRLQPERLARLHVAARFESPEAVRLDDDQQFFTLHDGRRIGLRGAVAKVAAYRLNEVWPRTQNLPALLGYVEQQLGALPEQAEAQLIALFERLVVGGFGRYRLSAVVGGPGAAGMPRVEPEVIAFAEATQTVTFNPWHESIVLDPFSSLLLPLLDGCHTQDELLEVIAAAIADERLGFMRDGQPITDREELDRTGVLHLHRVLDSLMA
ncbi:class I SAM-dependent methyltransferase [Pseudomonas sp. PDNC002]|uniref:class I SAM-dependent methyltransferase n=1 Tax=Pseudomonas sp. PDNC002 TaxID=2811422 RepID=UPI001965BBB6|nr:class I SAM-dependent methyltransferase [Pseudomonas sp. PDNC002]QRY78218.1 class I SAM-dependent methyltransferase [Pseudomonas sp. PDNC002]